MHLRLVSKLALIALLAAFVPTAPAAEGGRAFTIEDFYRAAVPGAPAMTPDGGALVYPLTTFDLRAGHRNRDLYRLELATGKTRALTHTADAEEWSPVFSPDGTRLAFISNREEGEQLWLLPTAGGEARRISDLPGGASHPVWAPGGTHIAVVSKVFPECGADAACHRERVAKREADPLEVHVADELLYRHWDAWADGLVSHILLIELESGEVRDLTPGEREAPAYFGGAAFVFSPDGNSLVYTQNPDPIETLAWSTNTDVFERPLAGTPAPRNLTKPNLAFDGHPAFSPDGKSVAYLAMERPVFEADRKRLVVLDRKSGATRELAPGFPDTVTSFTWAGDGSGIFFSAPRAGQTPIFFAPLDGGPARERVADAHFASYVVAPDGKTAYAVRSSVGEPAELWAYALGGAEEPRRLTFHNAELEREVDIRPAETIEVEGADGKPIQVFVVKPHGFDPAKKYPLVLNVHGGPQYQWADQFRGDWQVYPGAGYVVAFPNPHGSTGFGQDFTDAISGSWGGKPFEDVMKVTDALEKLPFVDSERIGAMGWSYGGYMMNWLLGSTDRYEAIASMMGIFDLASFYYGTEELWFPEWDLAGRPWDSDDYQRFNPAARAKKMGEHKTPTLIVTGEKDFRIPYTQSLMLFTALRRQGVPARLVVFPEAGHWPNWYEMAMYYTAHLEFFAETLGGGGPEWTVADFAEGQAFEDEAGKNGEE